jgi:hypothetical protein
MRVRRALLFFSIALAIGYLGGCPNFALPSEFLMECACVVGVLVTLIWRGQSGSIRTGVRVRSGALALWYE